MSGEEEDVALVMQPVPTEERPKTPTSSRVVIFEKGCCVMPDCWGRDFGGSGMMHGGGRQQKSGASGLFLVCVLLTWVGFFIFVVLLQGRMDAMLMPSTADERMHGFCSKNALEQASRPWARVFWPMWVFPGIAGLLSFYHTTKSMGIFRGGSAFLSQQTSRANRTRGYELFNGMLGTSVLCIIIWFFAKLCQFIDQHVAFYTTVDISAFDTVTTAPFNVLMPVYAFFIASGLVMLVGFGMRSGK